MRLRTPANDREWLAVPDFAEIPSLAEHNHRLLDASSFVVDGVPLPELRRLARRELLGRDHPAPLLVTGHQPEPFHPGVWVKNFAANGLAKRLGGSAVNLVVDNDTVKSVALPVPTWDRWEPEAVRCANVPFADAPAGRTWETLRPTAAFESFVRGLREFARPMGYEPIAVEAEPSMTGATVAERFDAARRLFEERWIGPNVEIWTSRLSRSEAFHHFANHLSRDGERFRGVHNAAVREYRRANRLRSRTHPVPELAAGEVPFWHVGKSGRERIARPLDAEQIRPRALTLTLFARVAFGDLFIHGIGGGKYDAVTDAIIRDYFGIEPPAYQVVSATLRLPVPGFATTEDDVKRLRRLVRDLHWNPQRHGADGAADHRSLCGRPPGKDQFRSFRALGERLRPQVAGQLAAAERTRPSASGSRSRCKRNSATKGLLVVVVPE
jgi:hypothetical protein